MMRTLLTILLLTAFQIRSYSAGVPDTGAASQLGLNPGDRTAPVAGIPDPAPARIGRDITADFKTVWDSVDQKLGDKEKEELRGYKVLLVRGFLTGGYVEPFKILGKKVWIGRYFNDQKKTLTELGVEFSMVDIDSVMMPAHNAAKVAAEIRKSEKPVIIISHSDGGMYALQALTENPELASKVRGFVPLQAPFLGTPVAEYVKNNKVFSSVMASLLGHFGGTLDSLASMTPTERAGFHETNRRVLNGLVSGVNVISFATWKAEEHGKLDTLLEIPRDLMLKKGIDNDGLTPTESSILPGSDYVKLEGVDHIMPVMSEDMIREFDRCRMTKTLLLMIISR